MRNLIISALLGASCSVSLVAQAQTPAQQPEQPFEENDGTWLCDGDGFTAEHCLNIRSQGRVGTIMVFDGRGPSEGISFDPRFDNIPCPNDRGSNDGTWWEIVTGVFVCHHSGRQ